MSSDTSSPVADREHRDCWDLLPWFLTERLGESDRTLVERHLAGCAECRAELEAQRRLRDDVAREDRVAYSPAASFEKLWSRIEELEREVPAAPEGNERMRLPSSVRRRTATRADTRLVRWLVAAVVVQAIAIGWLAGTVVSSRVAPSWPYRTVTSSAPAYSGAPRYRVVFAPQTSVSELQRVLAAHGLIVVHSSPASDVLTVALAAAGGRNADDVLESLRREGSVRFVEPVSEPAEP